MNRQRFFSLFAIVFMLFFCPAPVHAAVTLDQAFCSSRAKYLPVVSDGDIALIHHSSGLAWHKQNDAFFVPVSFYDICVRPPERFKINCGGLLVQLSLAYLNKLARYIKNHSNEDHRLDMLLDYVIRLNNHGTSFKIARWIIDNAEGIKAIPLSTLIAAIQAGRSMAVLLCESKKPLMLEQIITHGHEELWSLLGLRENQGLKKLIDLKLRVDAEYQGRRRDALLNREYPDENLSMVLRACLPDADLD